MKEPTKEQWAKWYAHKSNKEIWIEEQEREKEYQEALAEKLGRPYEETN